MHTYTKVLSAKVSNSEYNFCKSLAKDMYDAGVLKRPTHSELMRLLIAELMQKHKEQLRGFEESRGTQAEPSTAGNAIDRYPFQVLFQQPFENTNSSISGMPRTIKDSPNWLSETPNPPLPPNVRMTYDNDGTPIIDMLNDDGSVAKRFKQAPLF